MRRANDMILSQLLRVRSQFHARIYMSMFIVRQNYTQNIDTLETRAGVQKVLQCHGSFATASCINCHARVPGNVIEPDIMRHAIPLCQICTTAPVVKPKKKGKKKRNLPPWDSGGEEEPKMPAFPSGIMKVFHTCHILTSHRHQCADI